GPRRSPALPYTTLFRSGVKALAGDGEITTAEGARKPAGRWAGLGRAGSRHELAAWPGDSILGRLAPAGGSALHTDERPACCATRSEEHTSELQSRFALV